MRLTVFNTSTPQPKWMLSLNRLLDYNLHVLEHGNVNMAVFNDGVVGISITEGAEITFLKVRDITRRRGIGRYLLSQTMKNIGKNCKVTIDTSLFPKAEKDGAISFLLDYGFKFQTDNHDILEYDYKLAL